MKKVKFEAYCSFGINSESETFEVEFLKDLTDEEIEKEIEEIARDWAFNQFEWSYIIKK